jgi:hypothetical protein
MSYTEPFSRAKPGCILFLVDHSMSMADYIGGQMTEKCEVVKSTINQFLQELVSMCTFADPEPRHYLDVGVIGYSTDDKDAPVIGPAWHGALAGRDLVSIPDLYLHAGSETRIENDGLGDVEKIYPVWYEQATIRGTPMASALRYCIPILTSWCCEHATSYPPIVLHITDGEPSDDENPLPAAMQLRSLTTQDGAALLFNFHLSEEEGPSLMFPASEAELQFERSKLLFRMSSELPEPARRTASSKLGIDIPAGARGMAFNTQKATDLLKLIKTGTPTVANRRR